MYCRYCGREIGEKRNFCPHCGRNLSVAPPQPGQTRQAPETSYYAVEFAKIRAGQKTRFNWAAFWFGACHQLYHDSTALFCRTFLPVYITAFVWAIAQGLVLYTAPAYAMPLAIWMVEWGNVAVNVWLLTVMIWNAKTYNRKLYEQTGGNPAAVPQKFGKMILLIVVVLVYQWVLLPAIPDTDALQANVHMPGESVEMLLHTQLPENAWLSERVYFILLVLNRTLPGRTLISLFVPTGHCEKSSQ